MPQFTAGSSHVAENRKKYVNPDYKLEKLRDIEEEDVVRLLAHRAPGEEYKSIHPPLEEMEEPECAVREMVEPTEGAKAGDRIRYVQFIDSMQFAPITPRQRAEMAYNRYRGVDCGVFSGGTIIEGRERDVEKIAKELIDSETFDTSRTALRGRTVHGHSHRLDEHGMMFDALRRWSQDPGTMEVTYVKDMIGGAMDKEVVLGKPLPEDELLKRTTMYRNAAGGLWQEVDDPESMDVTAWIHWERTVGGFQPWKKVSEIKGGKKDIGVKDLRLFVERGGFSDEDIIQLLWLAILNRYKIENENFGNIKSIREKYREKIKERDQKLFAETDQILERFRKSEDYKLSRLFGDEEFKRLSGDLRKYLGDELYNLFNETWV